jgi:hypothetical protein
LALVGSTLLQKLSSDVLHIQWSFSLLNNIDNIIDFNVEGHSEGLDDFGQNFGIAFDITLLCGLKLAQEGTNLGLQVSVWVGSVH